jgi:hypothetical protein
MLAALVALLTAPAFAAAPRMTVPPLPRLELAAPALPSYLSVADPADAAWVARVVQAARASPAAMRVLRGVEKAAAARGRPVVVEVANIKEAGTYNYDWDALSLRRQDMKDGPAAAVPTLVHELQHMLQKPLYVPSDLLETELEAYTVDFRTARELGLTPKKGTYDERAHRAFKKGVPAFVKFLEKEYPEDQALYRRTAADYAARLEKQLKGTERKLSRAERERREKLAVLEQMKALGHPETETRNYREDALGPVERLIDELRRARDYALADLALLRDPGTRDAARRYARNVIRRARRLRL